MPLMLSRLCRALVVSLIAMVATVLGAYRIHSGCRLDSRRTVHGHHLLRVDRGIRRHPARCRREQR